MTDRTIPYDDNETCDTCGSVGAYDFMGDCLCQDCLDSIKDDTLISENEDD